MFRRRRSSWTLGGMVVPLTIVGLAIGLARAVVAGPDEASRPTPSGVSVPTAAISRGDPPYLNYVDDDSELNAAIDRYLSRKRQPERKNPEPGPSDQPAVRDRATPTPSPPDPAAAAPDPAKADEADPSPAEAAVAPDPPTEASAGDTGHPGFVTAEEAGCFPSPGAPLMPAAGPWLCAPALEVEWPPSAEQRAADGVAALPRLPPKFNVLILGLDRRDARGALATGKPYTDRELLNKPANSDVVMVVQFDLGSRRVRLVSIPRDTRVNYAGRGGAGKINAAYAYGRQKLARATVEKFLEIEIARTVVVDWRGAKKLITMWKQLGLDYQGFSEKEMFWHLRKRSFKTGDFRRIERQQLFLRHAGGEALRLANQTRQAPGAVGALRRAAVELALGQGLKVVETDLTVAELKMLAWRFRDYDVADMTLAQVKGTGGLDSEDDYFEGEGVYYLDPAPRHSFDEIVARIEGQTPTPAQP